MKVIIWRQTPLFYDSATSFFPDKHTWLSSSHAIYEIFPFTLLLQVILPLKDKTGRRLNFFFNVSWMTFPLLWFISRFHKQFYGCPSFFIYSLVFLSFFVFFFVFFNFSWMTFILLRFIRFYDKFYGCYLFFIFSQVFHVSLCLCL